MSPYTYNSSNELLSIPNGSYTYDQDGEMLTRPDGTQFSWDYEGRLAQAVLPNGGGTVTFHYDPAGRRIQKSGPLGTTNYFYDGRNILETTDQSGNPLSGYVTNGKIDEPLAESVSGAAAYYEQDGVGTVTSLTDANGNPLNTYTYDSFGNLTASMITVANPLEYTGREWDAETGLYGYRARYYDPQEGRFISEDPIQSKSGVNFYGYVRNNPVLLTDPLGLAPQKPGSGWWQWIKNCWNDIWSCGGNPGAYKVGPAPFNLCNAGDTALYSGNAPNNPWKTGAGSNSDWETQFRHDCENKAPPGKTNYVECSGEPISYGGTGAFCYCCQECAAK